MFREYLQICRFSRSAAPARNSYLDVCELSQVNRVAVCLTKRFISLTAVAALHIRPEGRVDRPIAQP